MRFLAVFLASAALAAPAWSMTLAVNEGTTYHVNEADILRKFGPLADDLSKLLHQKVNVVSVDDYHSLSEGLAAGRYELAYIHPTHIAFEGLTKDGYRLVAGTKGYTDYKAWFLVRSDSTAKSPADFKGRKLGIPAINSITSVLVRSTFREIWKDNADTSVSFVATRYQDAIPFMVENHLTEAGVTGSEGLAKAWVAKGGKVAFTSKGVPVKLMLATGKMSASDFAAVQSYFIGLDKSEKGRKVLEAMEKKGFVPISDAAIGPLEQWVSTGVKEPALP